MNQEALAPSNVFGRKYAELTPEEKAYKKSIFKRVKDGKDRSAMTSAEREEHEKFLTEVREAMRVGAAVRKGKDVNIGEVVFPNTPDKKIDPEKVKAQAIDAMLEGLDLKKIPSENPDKLPS